MSFMYIFPLCMHKSDIWFKKNLCLNKLKTTFLTTVFPGSLESSMCGLIGSIFFFFYNFLAVHTTIESLLINWFLESMTCHPHSCQENFFKLKSSIFSLFFFSLGVYYRVADTACVTCSVSGLIPMFDPKLQPLQPHWPFPFYLPTCQTCFCLSIFTLSLPSTWCCFVHRYS